MRAHDFKYLNKISKSVSELGDVSSRMLIGAHLLAVGRLKSEGNEDSSNLDMMVNADAGRQYYHQFLEANKVQKVENYLETAFLTRHGSLPSNPGVILKGGNLSLYPRGKRTLRDIRDSLRFNKLGKPPENEGSLLDKDSKRRALFHKMVLQVNPGEQREIREIIQHEDAKKRFDHAFLDKLPDEKNPDLAKMPFGKEGREALNQVIRSNEFSEMTEQAASEELIMLSIYSYLAEKKSKCDELQTQYQTDPNMVRPDTIAEDSPEWIAIRSKKKLVTRDLMTREEMEAFTQNDPYFEAKVALMAEHTGTATEVEACLKQLSWEDETAKPGSGTIAVEIPVGIDGSPDYEKLFHEDVVANPGDPKGRQKAILRINEGKARLRMLNDSITNMTYKDFIEGGFVPENMVPGYSGPKPAQPLTPAQFEEIRTGLHEQFYTQINRSVTQGQASIQKHEDGTSSSHIRFGDMNALNKVLGPNMALAAGNVSIMYRKPEYENKKQICQRNIEKMMRGKKYQRVVHHLKRHGPTYIAIWQRGQMLYRMGQQKMQESGRRDQVLEQLLHGGNN